MNDEEIRELATNIILDHARSVEFLTILERLPKELSEMEAEQVAEQIEGHIEMATITVQLPSGDGS